MKRIDAIKRIMKNVRNEVVITSAGMISRELFAVKDRPKNFYMMGSMGCALGVGLGIALNSRHKVIVISGDAAALMSLGTLALHRKLRPANLKHYILDNGCSSSTGGQPTCSDVVDFEKIGFNTRVIKVDKGKGTSPRIPMPPRKILQRFKDAVSPHST